MSKRLLAICLTMSVLVGSNAFASRARTAVMGTNDPLNVIAHGSFIADDNHNIFYNPSYMNDFKNWAAVEKWNGNTTSGNAEGGFVTGFMGMTLGAYFNRGDAVTGTTNFDTKSTTDGKAYGTGLNTLGTISFDSNTNTTPFRPIDLMLAGDMGVKWGLGVTYATRKTSPTAGSQDLVGRVGFQVADFEPFARYKFIGFDRSTGRRSSDWAVGTRYKYGEWTPFVAYNVQAVKLQKSDNNTLAKTTNYGVGLARSTKLGDAARLNYGLSFWRKTNGARSIVPLDVSAEGDLTSWMTARAGLSHRIWDRNGITESDTDTSATGAPTTGRLGATIHVNKIDFDWAVGSTAGTENPDGATFDLANGFFSAASLTYHW